MCCGCLWGLTAVIRVLRARLRLLLRGAIRKGAGEPEAAREMPDPFAPADQGAAERLGLEPGQSSAIRGGEGTRRGRGWRPGSATRSAASRTRPDERQDAGEDIAELAPAPRIDEPPGPLHRIPQRLRRPD